MATQWSRADFTVHLFHRREQWCHSWMRIPKCPSKGLPAAMSRELRRSRIRTRNPEWVPESRSLAGLPAHRLGSITERAFAKRFRRPSISARNYTFTIYDTIAYFAPFHWIRMNPNQPHSGYKQPSPIPDTESSGMSVNPSTGIPHAWRYSNVPS